jgi:alkylation response protein AidB-like acyl-CoA dehydrogenase
VTEPTDAADLLYSEVEDELRETVRALLAEHASPAGVLARTESAEAYDPRLWQALAGGLGCAGLAVPEALGGAGASFRETAVVMEELGRTVAPVPFLGSAVLATSALLAVDDRTLLPDVADGRTTACLVIPFSTPPGSPAPGGIHVDGAEAAGGSGAEGPRLTGTVTSVADALPADLLLVPVRDALYAVDPGDTDHVRRLPVTSLDMTRPLCDITFASAAARPVGTPGAARRAVTAALSAGAAMLSAEQLGIAERCLEMTVDYVKNRYQFARPVGSYQSLKHRLADLWVAITQARAVTRYAAARLADAGLPWVGADPAGPAHDADRETAVAIALAQAHCCAVAVQAAEECVQMHGGIGFTWEHPAHLFLKRAKSAAIALGTADRHRDALAELVDIPS